MPDVTMLCGELKELQVQRRACIKAIGRINNAAFALVRRALGYRPDMPEKERAKLCRQAQKAIKDMERGDPSLDASLKEFVSALRPFILRCVEARKPFESMRRELERTMEKDATGLPAFDWWNSHRGLGALGLACVIGESGDLSTYSNPAKLWKRLGLAVINGKAQGKRTNPVEAEENGYNPARRSVMWNIGDSLLKGNKDGWKSMYDARKAYETERDPEMKPMRAHRRAQRYVEKRVLRDLWRQWRKAIGVSATNSQVPSATA